MRMMAKLVIRVQNGGYSQRSFYSKNEFRKLRDLMTRRGILMTIRVISINSLILIADEKEIRDDPKRMDYFETCILPFLKHFFSDQTAVPNTKELLQLYGKVS